MGTVRADAKGRIVIPGAKPGDVFDVQRQGDDRCVFVRLRGPSLAPGKSREECLEAMSRSPLSTTLSSEQLRQITREP
jgi:bifunctional DNA-binding transcriptional regulator/antitoxin component of YhaV-PrlF toxin-antitoxin module